MKRIRHHLNRIFLLFVLFFAAALVVPSDVPASGGTILAQAATSKATVAKKANSIISSVVEEEDTALEQLEKLFVYAEKKWGYSRSTTTITSLGTARTFAYSIYKNKAGSCYHFAAGYAYLARQALGSSKKYTVRIAVGQTNGFGNGLQAHAWVEIKINGTWYVFDPNLDKFAENSSLKYYMAKRSKSSVKKVYNKYKNVKYYTMAYKKI
ncbi:MAG: transglutaminase-like domain-containing protein [Lachnospiraceae bacterium]|nr:transglutaminase-like domain-containing protein [Lachnospiraceae bacterium]